MIDKVIFIITALFGIIIAAFLQGKKAERSKQNKRAIKTVKKVNEIKENIANLSRTDKRNRLRPKNDR